MIIILRKKGTSFSTIAGLFESNVWPKPGIFKLAQAVNRHNNDKARTNLPVLPGLMSRYRLDLAMTRMTNEWENLRQA